jgi:hypothetical protein
MPRRTPFLVVLLLAAACQAGTGDAVTEVQARPRAAAARQLVVERPAEGEVAAGSRLLVTSGVSPETWGRWLADATEGAVFEIADEHWTAADEHPRRYWLVAPDVGARLLERWPEGAALEAGVDSLGLAERTAWLCAGTDQGIRAGDCWWLRVGGQPATRCDVLYVGPDVCFCTIVPLAGDTPLRQGTRLALWPTPTEKRAGRASTAVAYVERRSGDTLVWVAAPVGVPCPSEAHLDFFHQRQYLGYGLVERRDNRFWYARFTSVPPTDATAPTTMAAPPEPRVGDTVWIRTQADIAAHRFVARIFELTPSGALANAGEGDGLHAGQRLSVFRSGDEVGTVAVRRAQHSYAEVGPVADSNAPTPLRLCVADELRCDAPPSPPQYVGALDAITGELLFTARLNGQDAPLAVPLAVQARGRTVGVAVLVVAEAGHAGGFVLPGSLTQGLAAGMELVLDSDRTASTGERGVPRPTGDSVVR